MDATVADPVIGRLLDGRYTAQERIAAGGMATVYVAHDNRLDRMVALKVMHPGFAHDQDFVRRFNREATAAARLNTPYVVSILDQGSDHGPGGPLIYLVMELVRGQTLRQLIGVRGRLRPTEAVEIIEPVLEALSAAHSAGIIHRDIKPENILLGQDGQVKVADFGLARPLNQATYAATQGVVMGTVGYLAPEQVSDGSADTRSDVYAAGIVFYEMLTGQLPHTGSTPMSVAYQAVHGDVPAPSAMAREVPAELDAVVLRATSRDPDNRPSDGAAMLDELRQVLAYLPESVLRGESTGSGTALFGLADGERPEDDPWISASGVPAVSTRPTTGFAPGDHHLAGRRSRRRPPQRSPLPSRRLLIAAALILTLVAGLVLAKAMSGPGSAPVPPLVGLDRATAEKTLRDAGFVPVFDNPETSDKIPEGRVVRQDPASTVRADRGGTVHLVLSLGRAKVRVPNVATLSVTEATSRLTQAQLNVAAAPRTEPNETIIAGSVIRTDPAIGAELAQGTEVTLVVSAGPALVTIPSDLVGKTFEQAQSQLVTLGLQVSRTEVFDDSVPAGRVVRTYPEGGQQVNRGTTVTVLVATGSGDDEDGGEQVEIPDVIGDRYQVAARKLQRVGLRAERTIGLPFADTVKDANPDVGTKVRRGATVTLILE